MEGVRGEVELVEKLEVEVDEVGECLLAGGEVEFGLMSMGEVDGMMGVGQTLMELRCGVGWSG